MRIVVKLGTSTLAHGTGHLNIRRVEEICKVISDIKNFLFAIFPPILQYYYKTNA